MSWFGPNTVVHAPNQRHQQAKPSPGESSEAQGPVRSSCFLGVILAAHSSQSQPVNSAQLMAWLTAGVPCNRLVRMVQERGIAKAPGKEQFGNWNLPAPIRI